MFTLRLTQYADSEPNFYRIEVTLEGDSVRQTATVRFKFELKLQEQENIRWYLEDYLQYLSDPAPQIAAKIEKRMAEIGVELFTAIFEGNDDARDLWIVLRENLHRTRVEILTELAQATTIPWELLRDPQTDTCLALRSPAFVRSYLQSAQRSRLPQANGDAIRILLVICRPQGREDVPFRSIANRLIKGLGTRPDGFQLDVLRPPTFNQLSDTLQQAKVQGKPYHVVHFDGHGVFLDAVAETSGTSPDPKNMRGYLIFENPDYQKKQEWIHGKLLGKVLVDSDVPLLILNACRSAHAEALEQPSQVDSGNSGRFNSQTRLRAFGSLAQEVMDAGVAGVVAMRYNVYVMTAAQFVAGLYTSLVQGQTLGEAVTSGRKQLSETVREVTYKPVALQDWLVPVVYEAAPIALFSASIRSQTLTITLHENDPLPTTEMLDAQLPTTPDIGFLGRDETLLAIDRAFDNHAIVLLHAFAGSGKTSVAAEFGRWYALTGGLLESGRQGYVLFTSFQRYLSLSRVLDKLGQVFERDLERSGIHWLSLSDEQRRTVALQVLSKVPVLWIWDNVEPIAGFPDGETQRWSEAEQQELADFLRDARNTKAKFLLTSRRDEREWLGDLPARVRVPPMPMQERVQFAYALAEKHGYGSVDVGNWLPLLRYSQGNPLTITVVVSQALRNGYRSKEHIEKFVADLRSGEAELDDDESEGRSLSLGASLSYGFTNSFSSQECKHLALLHFFRECVWGETFHLMSLQRTDGWLVPMEELTLESVTNLLDRAAAVGLLGVASLQGSEVKYYDIHPALPWYFQKLFEKYYPISASSPTEITQELAAKAFVAAIAWAGNAAYNRYVNGIRLAIVTLVVEEANLLYARNLSKLNGWWDHVLEATQGLLGLYKETGRYLEWAKLIDELQLDFIDQTTLLPMSGRKQMWHVVVGHYTLLAERTGQLEQLEQAEKMLLNVVNDLLPQVCEITKDSVKLKDPKCYNVVQSLAITKEAIGRISYQRGKDVCLSLFQEALSLCEKIHDKMEQAILFFQMGHAYLYLDTLRDFEKAEECYQQSLKLGRKDDDLWQGKCLNQLGRIHYDCFFKCRRDNHPEDKCLYHLNNSAHYYHKSLSILPSYALDDLSVAHGSLGIIYGDVGDINRCLLHHQKAIRYMEQLGNNESAAHTRYSAAFFLAHAGRIADALIYAESAILGYTKLGNIAAAEIQRIKNWMSKIQRSG